MQVVAARHSRMPDIPDMLPDTDMSARPYMQPVHMRVQCRVSSRMPDMYEPAVTPAVACFGNPAVTRTVHRSAIRRGQVHPWWNSLLPFTGCLLLPNVDETLKRVYLLSRGNSTG